MARWYVEMHKTHSSFYHYLQVGVHRLKNFCLATVGKLRVRLLFPRMGIILRAHKGEARHVSTEDLVLFYDKVVVPAVHEAAPHYEMYWPVDREHAFWKAHSRDKHGQKYPTRTVPAHATEALLRAMHRIVNDPNNPHHEQLETFMNFIMYYEAQDTKMATGLVSNSSSD